MEGFVPVESNDELLAKGGPGSEVHHTTVGSLVKVLINQTPRYPFCAI